MLGAGEGNLVMAVEIIVNKKVTSRRLNVFHIVSVDQLKTRQQIKQRKLFRKSGLKQDQPVHCFGDLIQKNSEKLTDGRLSDMSPTIRSWFINRGYKLSRNRHFKSLLRLPVSQMDANGIRGKDNMNLSVPVGWLKIGLICSFSHN